VVAVTTVVSQHGDIKADGGMTTSDRDAVARRLQRDLADDVLLAFIPGGVREEKGVDSVISRLIKYETDKAFLVEIDGRDVWLPKSVITRFVAESGADINVPQRGLAEFVGGGQA